MSQRIKYDFREQEVFAALLFPAVLLPLYVSSDLPILLKISFYVLPGWLLCCFSFASVRITDDAIIIITYLKPFKKVYRYTYKDLISINIRHLKSRWRIAFIFSNNKKSVVGIPYQLENICKFLLDKGVHITSADGDAWHFINRYKNDPAANYMRRQLRKAKRRTFK